MGVAVRKPVEKEVAEMKSNPVWTCGI